MLITKILVSFEIKRFCNLFYKWLWVVDWIDVTAHGQSWLAKTAQNTENCTSVGAFISVIQNYTGKSI